MRQFWAKRRRVEAGIAAKDTRRRKKGGNAGNEASQRLSVPLLRSFRFLRLSLSAGFAPPREILTASTRPSESVLVGVNAFVAFRVWN